MICKTGQITSGEYRNWKIQIIDDSDGETGGYYILLKSDDGQNTFDYWFENSEFLTNQLSDFAVVWDA